MSTFKTQVTLLKLKLNLLYNFPVIFLFLDFSKLALHASQFNVIPSVHLWSKNNHLD